MIIVYCRPSLRERLPTEMERKSKQDVFLQNPLPSFAQKAAWFPSFLPETPFLWEVVVVRGLAFPWALHKRALKVNFTASMGVRLGVPQNLIVLNHYIMLWAAENLRTMLCLQRSWKKKELQHKGITSSVVFICCCPSTVEFITTDSAKYSNRLALGMHSFRKWKH